MVNLYTVYLLFMTAQNAHRSGRTAVQNLCAPVGATAPVGRWGGYMCSTVHHLSYTAFTISLVSHNKLCLATLVSNRTATMNPESHQIVAILLSPPRNANGADEADEGINMDGETESQLDDSAGHYERAQDVDATDDGHGDTVVAILLSPPRNDEEGINMHGETESRLNDSAGQYQRAQGVDATDDGHGDTDSQPSYSAQQGDRNDDAAVIRSNAMCTDNTTANRSSAAAPAVPTDGGASPATESAAEPTSQANPDNSRRDRLISVSHEFMASVRDRPFRLFLASPLLLVAGASLVVLSISAVLCDVILNAGASNADSTDGKDDDSAQDQRPARSQSGLSTARRAQPEKDQ